MGYQEIRNQDDEGMSYQEKRTIVSLISTLLIPTLYFLYMFQGYPKGDAYSIEVYRFWGRFILILIPVSIVAKIIIYIVFSIINTIATKEEEPSVSDERDRLIELKSTRNSFYVFILGFFLAMGSIVMEMPPSVMFAILIFFGMVAELVGELSQLYFYRRGL